MATYTTTLKINDRNIIDLTDFETNNGRNKLYYGRVIEDGVEFHIGDEVTVIDSELHLINFGEENLCNLEIKEGDTIIILDLNEINVIVGAKYYVYTSVYEHIKSLDCEGIEGDWNGEAKVRILSFPLRADSQYRYMKEPRFVQYMDNVSSWFICSENKVFDQFKDGDTLTLVEADGNASALAVGFFDIVTSKRLKILVGGGSEDNTTNVVSIDKPLDEGNRYKVIISEEELYLDDIDPSMEQPEDSDIIVIDNYELGRNIYCNEDTDKWLFLLELDSEDNVKYWAKEKTFFTAGSSTAGYNTLALTCTIGSSDNYCKLIVDDAPQHMYYMYAFTDQDPLLYVRPNKDAYTYWDGHSEIKAFWGARIQLILIANNRVLKTGKTDCVVNMP